MYFPHIQIKDIIEILIVTIIVYEIMLWIKNTKAWMLLRGMLMLGGFILLAWLFQMNTILYLAKESINVLAIAAIVVFQPELRRALEKLGEKNLFSNINPFDKNKENQRFSDETLDSIVRACYAMGSVCTGALIVVEQVIQLTEYEAQIIHKELEVLMHLMNIEHHFLFRRIQAACNSLFLDIADFLSRKTVIKKEISRKDHVLQEFHALVTRNFREEHFVSFYADKLAISEQYLARIVRLGTGKTINSLINELLVMEARTLLSSTKFTVGEIAAKLGFSDAAGFCKFFKRNAGQTPLNYRKGLLI